MADEVLQNTLDIEVGGEHYIFAIPSFHQEIMLGVREQEIRRQAQREMFGPDYFATGAPTGDGGADFLVATAAQFEVLLRRASVKWPYTAGPVGEPVVDHTQWPLDKVSVAMQVGMRYQAELRRFREAGVADNKPPSGEAVVGGENPEMQPVQPGPAGA